MFRFLFPKQAARLEVLEGRLDFELDATRQRFEAFEGQAEDLWKELRRVEDLITQRAKPRKRKKS